MEVSNNIILFSIVFFKILCYDWDSDGSHDFIGGFTTNLREMCSAQPSREVQNKVKDIYLNLV